MYVGLYCLIVYLVYLYAVESEAASIYGDVTGTRDMYVIDTVCDIVISIVIRTTCQRHWSKACHVQRRPRPDRLTVR